MLNEIVVAAAGSLVGGQVFLDDVPDMTPPAQPPYLTTMLDLLPRTVGAAGDGRALGWIQAGQVSLWQRLGTEDDTLLDRVINALDGFRPSGPPFLRLQVQYSVKLAEGPLAGSLVQDAITLRAARVR